MSKSSISFILPAYNEKANIEKEVKNVYDYLSQRFTSFEIIVVNDGSTDGMSEVCHNLIPKFNSKLVILTHSSNRGYGAALRTGLFSAKYDLVFYTDSDNQFDINDLKSFLDAIENYDMVIGYRIDRKDPIIRKFSSKVYNRLIFLLFGLNVRDIDCSFKLFKRNSLLKLSIDTDEFLVDTELLVKAKRLNQKIKEIGVAHLPRTFGKSTVRPRHILSTIRDIGILWKRLKQAN